MIQVSRTTVSHEKLYVNKKSSLLKKSTLSAHVVCNKLVVVASRNVTMFVIPSNFTKLKREM